MSKNEHRNQRVPPSDQGRRRCAVPVRHRASLRHPRRTVYVAGVLGRVWNRAAPHMVSVAMPLGVMEQPLRHAVRPSQCVVYPDYTGSQIHSGTVCRVCVPVNAPDMGGVDAHPSGGPVGHALHPCAYSAKPDIVLGKVGPSHTAPSATHGGGRRDRGRMDALLGPRCPACD